MNSKECLEKISWRYVMDPSFQEWCNIVKQDLDRLENLEDNIKIHKETIKMQQNQIESLQSENTKLEKAIKIIVNKGIHVLFLKHTKTFDHYNKIVRHQEYYDELTQEEYELLKEVLGND